MNYIAIAAGAVTLMVLGAVWYHPKVLGKTWMKGAGLTEAELNQVNPVALIGGLLMACVLSWATARYAYHEEEGMSEFLHGMFHGFMPAITYVAPVLVSKGLFEKKDLGWILTGVVYWVLTISIVGGIVYVMIPPK